MQKSKAAGIKKRALKKEYAADISKRIASNNNSPYAIANTGIIENLTINHTTDVSVIPALLSVIEDYKNMLSRYQDIITNQQAFINQLISNKSAGIIQNNNGTYSNCNFVILNNIKAGRDVNTAGNDQNIIK